MASPQKENGYTEISNEILESLAKIRIPGEARQMLDVVIRKTYGFNKKHDSIATSQFVKLTGLPRYAIHRARIKLVKMNLITVTKKADSQILTYSYQKDYDKWELSPKKVTVTKKATHCNQKSNALYPKKVTNCNPKSGTQKKERNYTKETIQKTGGDFPFLKDKNFLETFNAFRKMRVVIKKPLTEEAERLALKKLHNYDLKIAIKMMENSIMYCWQGLFELKEKERIKTQGGFNNHGLRKL